MGQDELVAAHVRALIRSGELKPGDRLPWTHEQLAELLGVNRNSVYWGLTTLRRERLIIGVRGGRAVVAGTNEDANGEDSVTEEL